MAYDARQEMIATHEECERHWIVRRSIGEQLVTNFSWDRTQENREALLDLVAEILSTFEIIQAVHRNSYIQADLLGVPYTHDWRGTCANEYRRWEALHTNVITVLTQEAPP